MRSLFSLFLVKPPPPSSLLLAAVAFVAGYACSCWISRRNPGISELSLPAMVSTGAAVSGPLSPSELRGAISAQEAVVAENRRRLEEVLPDVPEHEERLQRTLEIVSEMSRPDLPERELMELAIVLGGAAWMPQTVADYRKNQEEYRSLGDGYGAKHPKMAALDQRIAGLAAKITEEAERVFNDQETRLATLERELPEVRAKAAQARETPELWQPLEQALHASETRLRDLRSQLAATLIRQRR